MGDSIAIIMMVITIRPIDILMHAGFLIFRNYRN